MIQPLGSRVLCRAVDTDESLPGQKIILLADTRENLTSEQAEVVAVGPDVEGLKAGDWVMHRPFARKEGPDDSTFWLLADDILCTLSVE